MQRHLALVTGGARGIGRAIAARLVKEGAEVIIRGRNQEVLAEATQAHETCCDTGEIFEAGGGWFAQLRREQSGGSIRNDRARIRH